MKLIVQKCKPYNVWNVYTITALENKAIKTHFMLHSQRHFTTTLFPVLIWLKSTHKIASGIFFHPIINRTVEGKRWF